MHSWWEGTQCCDYGGQYVDSSKIKKELPYGPVLLQMKTVIRKDTCTPMLIETLFTVAKVWQQLKCFYIFCIYKNAVPDKLTHG